MTHYPHPKPSVDTLSQTFILIGLGMIVVSIIGIIVLVLNGAPSGFLLMIPVICALAMPLVMRLSVTPPVTVDGDGFTITPRFGKVQRLAWDDVEKVAPFPLLPSEEAEVVRRATIGKNNYAVAKGLMLIIPILPVRYRVAGWFAGEGGKPIIAITNRSHANYAQLEQTVLKKTQSQSKHVG